MTLTKTDHLGVIFPPSNKRLSFVPLSDILLVRRAEACEMAESRAQAMYG